MALVKDLVDEKEGSPGTGTQGEYDHCCSSQELADSCPGSSIPRSDYDAKGVSF
jgi:hypothetical protein